MKKIFKMLSVLAIILALSLSAISCSSGGDGYLDGRDRLEYSEDGGSSGSSGALGGVTNGSGSSSTVLEDRKIIKTVHESVQTDSYDSFMTALGEAVISAGGYISSREERGENYYNKNNLRHLYTVIRIPADRLDVFTEALDAVAVVTSFSESVNDVTGAYIDVESRISVLEAEEAALLSMLEAATTVDTALEIRTRLLTVQSDLASLRNQKESYDDRIAYSTVYLTVSEVRVAVTENPGFLEEVRAEFSENLYDLGVGFRAFGVWLLGDSVSIIITLGVLTGGFFLARFLLKRYSAFRLARRRDVAEPADAKDGISQNESSEDGNGATKEQNGQEG
jgi:hypothetical protein